MWSLKQCTLSPALVYCICSVTGGFIALIMLGAAGASQSCIESSDLCTPLENFQRFHNGLFGFNVTFNQINLHKESSIFVGYLSDFFHFLFGKAI